MPCNYVLIDFENVQPDNLEKLINLPVKVYVFVGEQQTKLTFEFSDAMQRLGDRASYTKIAGNGPNALDFHIAYYVGELAATEPDAYFHIISKDAGFDPLIEHLRKKRTPALRIYRVDDIEKAAFLRPTSIGTLEERLALLTENLIKRGHHLPRKRSTLETLIHAHFGKKLLDREVQQMIDVLQKRKILSIADGMVQYHLPHPGLVVALAKKSASG